MIITKDNSQDKLSRKIDKNFNKKDKKIPLGERKFSDLVSLKDQLKWLELKKKQKDKMDFK
jgi:hypothetical protein